MPDLRPGTRVVASPLLDELIGDDGSVVLVSRNGQDSVVRLTTLGAAARSACEGGIRLDALAAHLADVFGEPREGGILEATLLVVQSLEEAGLVEVNSVTEAGLDS